MKKLQEDAKERICNKFLHHPVFAVIKKTEIDWFKQVSNYRLSAEQVFCEIIRAIDSLKLNKDKLEWCTLYEHLSVDYYQSAPITLSSEEIHDIVSIIMISLFSTLGLSDYARYQSLARQLADQCAENNKGYFRRFTILFDTFDLSANEIGCWIDDYLAVNNQECLSDQLELLVHPNHYSQYLKRGPKPGKSDDELQANFAKAARNGAAALVKYLTTPEGKLYFDFLGHNKPQIVDNINRELGTSLTYRAFRQAVNRSKNKPNL